MKRKLPTRVVESHGALYYIQDLDGRSGSGKPKQRWHWLCRADDGVLAMHDAIGKLLVDTKRAPSSVPAIISAWKRDVVPRYADKTRSEYERMADVVSKSLDDFNDIATLRPKHIAEFIDTNFRDAPNMAKKYRALFSLIMSYAVRRGFLDSNPAREVSMREYKEKKRSRYITDEELAAIRTAAMTGTRSGVMTVCMIDLAVITGQRIGDIISLTWSQVRKEGIVFKPAKMKNSTGIVVPVKMTDQLGGVLERARTSGKVKGVNVIHTMRGRPYTYHGAHSAWRRAVLKAGINGSTHFHDLKRKALTDAKRQGKDAQKLGGHADAKMTAHYIEQVGIEWIEPPTIAIA